MDNQQFSVLMSVYAKDNPKWFEEAVLSITNQTASPGQTVIVVDGQITEELERILEKYKKQTDVLRLEKNYGLGIALQKGLEICKYPLVARMDSDDISLHDRFEKQLNVFQKNQNLSIVGGYIQEVDCDIKKNIAVRKVPLTDSEIKQYIKTRTPFNHPTVMFKKDAVIKAGNYQDFYFMEDYYLWVRMVANDFKMANLPEILVNMRVNLNLYSRRGGYKYFKNNHALSKEMLKMGIITYPFYMFNVFVRFFIQVLMPNYLRKFFYKKVLR